MRSRLKRFFDYAQARKWLYRPVVAVLFVAALLLFWLPFAIGARSAFSRTSGWTIPEAYEEWVDFLNGATKALKTGKPVK